MEDDHSIDREPHLRPRSYRDDPSEARAKETLSGESHDSAAREHSVFNEPAIFPDQQGVAIDQDWTCSKCGYNLRGLLTGQRCPECGQIELYHPPPVDSESFAQWLEDKRARTTRAQRSCAVILVAIFGGPFAVFGAIFNTMGFSWMASIVIGPTVEEMMKIASVTWLVETRPYLIRTRREIILTAMMSAFVFAVIENVLYLSVFMTAPTGLIVAWRWIACTILHVSCTAIAAQGVARAWQTTADDSRPLRGAAIIPTLTTAIILHGAYNAIATALEIGGLLF